MLVLSIDPHFNPQKSNQQQERKNAGKKFKQVKFFINETKVNFELKILLFGQWAGI
jgi:hypothetical protein